MSAWRRHNACKFISRKLNSETKLGKEEQREAATMAFALEWIECSSGIFSLTLRLYFLMPSYSQHGIMTWRWAFLSTILSLRRLMCLLLPPVTTFFCVITYGLANLTKNSIITVHMLLLLPVVLLRYSFNASIITIFSLSKFSSTTVARIFFNFMPSCVFKDQMQTHKYISTF